MSRINLQALGLILMIVIIFLVSVVSFVNCVDSNGWDRVWYCTDRVIVVKESPRNSP